MNKSEPSIRIVIGMPGSGKTTYLNKLLAEGVIDCYFDDYQKGAPRLNGPDEPAEWDPHLSPNYSALVAAISAGQNVAISEITYCVPKGEALIRGFVAAEFPKAHVVLVYFANDPEACRHNVRLRNREGKVERELRNIGIITPQYNPPQKQAVPVIMG